MIIAAVQIIENVHIVEYFCAEIREYLPGQTNEEQMKFLSAQENSVSDGYFHVIQVHNRLWRRMSVCSSVPLVGINPGESSLTWNAVTLRPIMFNPTWSRNLIRFVASRKLKNLETERHERVNWILWHPSLPFVTSDYLISTKLDGFIVGGHAFPNFFESVVHRVASHCSYIGTFGCFVNHRSAFITITRMNIRFPYFLRK